MYRNILVPATGTAADAAVFATALLAARQFGGHLSFLHVRVDTTDVLLSMTSGGVGGGDAVQAVVDRIEAESVAQEATARRSVEAFCTQAGIAMLDAPKPGVGPSASYAVEIGNQGRWVAEYGRFADLLVIGRGDPDDGTPEVLEAALMDTGRPLLIAPRSAPVRVGTNVMIAWKDTAEAARAVACAIPFIAAATSVAIATVTEGQTEDPGAARLEQALRWHNPAVSVRRLAGGGEPAVEVLLREADATGTDLLVMGGYSHSRLREVVFGGFTRRVLGDAGLPVLIAH